MKNKIKLGSTNLQKYLLYKYGGILCFLVLCLENLNLIKRGNGPKTQKSEVYIRSVNFIDRKIKRGKLCQTITSYLPRKSTPN